MYKVRFLNDEEFERLPGRDMDTKLGVAYPNYGEAYVRKTGSNLVDVFTLAHELEHLDGKTHDEHYDSKNQCYYKDFGQALGTAAPFLSFIPGIGPLLSAGAGLGAGFMNASSQSKAQKNAANQQQDLMNQMSSSMSPGMPSGAQATQDMAMPATSMASGGSGSNGVGGGMGGNSVKSLSQQPQFNYNNDVLNQQYGNQSGRSSLMNIFGGS